VTHSELAAALDAQRYDILWYEAVPLAKFAVGQMSRAGLVDAVHLREDLLQEAITAAGEAIRTWDPMEGAFSTWVVAAVKGALLSYVSREANGLQAPLHFGRFYGVDEEFIDLDESDLTYENTPEGFDEPSVGLEHEDDRDDVAMLLGRLKSPEEQDMLMRLYGLDCEPVTQIEYAREQGVSLSTVKKKLALTLAFLRQTAKKLIG